MSPNEVWTFNSHSPSIVLAGSLGESCAEFTRGRQSEHLWSNAKQTALRIATDASISFAQMWVCVCKPVVCSQTRTLAQTLSKQHLCWPPSDDSVKNNHKLSLGNILHLSIRTVSISVTKCTGIDQPTSPGWNTRVFAELLKSNLGVFNHTKMKNKPTLWPMNRIFILCSLHLQTSL